MELEYLLLESIASEIATSFSNPHADNYEKGSRYLKRVIEVEWNEDMDIYEIWEFARNNEQLKSAIYEFTEIDEDDKLYLRVASKFYLAICYLLKLDFNRARRCISEVESVEYNFFTLKKDTIESFRRTCPSLRTAVDDYEEKIKILIQNIQEQASGQVEVPSRNWWKITTIVLVLLVIVAIVIVLMYFNN